LALADQVFNLVFQFAYNQHKPQPDVDGDIVSKGIWALIPLKTEDPPQHFSSYYILKMEDDDIESILFICRGQLHRRQPSKC
jgi:hypothetical protein